MVVLLFWVGENKMTRQKIKTNPLRKAFEKIATKIGDRDRNGCILISEYLYEKYDENWSYNEEKYTKEQYNKVSFNLSELESNISQNIFENYNYFKQRQMKKFNVKMFEENCREYLKLNCFVLIPKDSESPIWDMEEIFEFDKKIVEGVKEEIVIQKKHGKNGYIVTAIEIKKRKPVIHLFWSRTEKLGFAQAHRLYKNAEVSAGKSNQTNIEKCAESACGWLQSDVERAELINFYGFETYWSNRGNPDPLYDRMKKELKA